MPAAASVELSFAGYDFFTSIFEKYDRDKDKALSPQELVNLFSTCPVMAWGPDVYNTVPLNNHGYIGLQGYLSLWTLTTLLDTQKTLEHLAYMGYTFHAGEENQINALTIANERKIDLGTIHILRKQVFGLFLILTHSQCLCQPDLWIYYILGH